MAGTYRASRRTGATGPVARRAARLRPRPESAGRRRRSSSAARPQAAKPAANERILVVVELSGANDGLNTVVPLATMPTTGRGRSLDCRPRACGRSTIISASRRGWPVSSASTRMVTWPSSRASATSIRPFRISPRWPTGTPARPTAATPMAGSAGSPTPSIPADSGEFLVNVQSGQSLAVRAEHHVPLVFDDPAQFARGGFHDEQAALRTLAPSVGAAQRDRGISVRCRAQRADRRTTCARGLRQLSFAGRLRTCPVRAGSRRRPDRRRLRDANLLRVLSAQRVRHPCLSG